MRKILTATLAICATFAAARGQQKETPPKPDESALLASLKSSNDGERLSAFYQLRSSPSAVRSPKVRAALIDLLDKEVQEELTNRKEGEGESEGGDEYMGDLTNTVATFADWSNAHQVCLLVAQGSLPTSTYAEHARFAIPCLLTRARSNLSWNRGPAVALLVEVLANKKTAVDASTIDVCKQIVRNGLHDPVDGVRIGVVHALAGFGGEDMISALREVAESDPYVDKDSHSFWIREYATQAIDAIEQRAAKH